MSSFSHYRVNNDEQIPIMEGTVDDETGQFLPNLIKNLEIKITSLTGDEIVFDLIGVDASIANALRRILLAEVPTVAIETIYMQDNTSVIQDEILSHRLGLIPIKVDPRLFMDKADNEDPTDQNTVVFNLDVTCNPPPGSNNDGQYTEVVLSSHLQWQPQGDQEMRFPDGIYPVHSDIVIAKLRKGQHIEAECHCRKGVGKDHTKFSPCATASYRLLPEIIIPTPITGKKAEELVEMCPLKVFDIEDMAVVDSRGQATTTATAVVARPRDCTMCRECIRREGWADRVHLRRVAHHFIFTVESSGCLPPEDIVLEAIRVLREKAQKFKSLASDSQRSDGE